jgi:hypothetical protein
MGLKEAGWEGDVAEFEAHVRSEFARFEEYLLSRGVSLSREARIEAFVEIFEVQTVEDDEEGDEEEGEEEGEGDEQQQQGQEDWGASEFRGLVAGMLRADGGGSKGGSGRGVTGGSRQGAAAAGEGVDGQADGVTSSTGQDAAAAERKGSSWAGGSGGQQKGELPASRTGSNSSNSNSSSGGSSGGIGSSPGWEQFRSNFGQEGVDKLQELLRGESLLMSGMELSDMLTLSDALNRMKQVRVYVCYGGRGWLCLCAGAGV